MGRAKDLVVKPISAKDANRIIRDLHYSGKVVPNSQIHLGVFLDEKCGGAMQFGPSLMRKTMVNLVRGTELREVIELNRMAFADWLPRNGESRCIAIAMRMLRNHYPHIKWVVSFADGCQCGDGTIYRASGFLLTAIRENDALRINPESGEVQHAIRAHHDKKAVEYRTWEKLSGYQMRYVYFLKPEERANLTCEVIPYSRIKEIGAGMYRGQRRAGSIGDDAPGDQSGEGGSTPTPALQPDG